MVKEHYLDPLLHVWLTWRYILAGRYI